MCRVVLWQGSQHGGTRSSSEIVSSATASMRWGLTPTAVIVWKLRWTGLSAPPVVSRLQLEEVVSNRQRSSTSPSKVPISLPPRPPHRYRSVPTATREVPTRAKGVSALGGMMVLA